MEEEIEPSQQYVDAFNLGYDLAKVSPELADAFVGLKAQSPVMNSIKFGINQYGIEKDYGREQNPSRMPDWLTKDRFADNKDSLTDPEKGKDIDKDE